MDNNRIPDQRPDNRSRRKYDVSASGTIYIGAVLIAAGLVWLLDNLGIVGYVPFQIVFSWQMLLVVIGGYMLSVRKWGAGAIIGGLGLAFLLMDLLNVHMSFWRLVFPVVIIALGVSLIVSRLRE